MNTTPDMFPEPERIWPFAHLKALGRAVEMHETPEWAAESILDVELLTPVVLDPCCGRGVLSEAAINRGYEVIATDLVNWGYGLACANGHFDFLKMRPDGFEDDFSVFMNPPFSLAVEFVKHALNVMGARKVVCFQRFAWWESTDRREFWGQIPPTRMYVCETRASCWSIHIPDWKRKGSTPTAHAWFVWERGQPNGPITGRLERKWD